MATPFGVARLGEFFAQVVAHSTFHSISISSPALGHASESGDDCWGLCVKEGNNSPVTGLVAEARMRRFDDDTYYRPSDEAMRLIATVGGLAQWRHFGKGPPFTKFGQRILYLGADLNHWMDEHRVEPKVRGAKTDRTEVATARPDRRGRSRRR